MQPVQIAFLIVALLLFLAGSSARWWPTPQQPYYGSAISMGLFFVVLSQIWPILTK